jgi:hypothetical protein
MRIKIGGGERYRFACEKRPLAPSARAARLKLVNRNAVRRAALRANDDQALVVAHEDGLLLTMMLAPPPARTINFR